MLGKRAIQPKYSNLDGSDSSLSTDSRRKKSPIRRFCCRFEVILMFCSASLVVMVLGLWQLGVFSFPLHAQCSVDWHFNIPCHEVASKLQAQIDQWKTADNCAKGGEKCLYKFVSFDGKELKATHETPVKHYVDDLTFTFKTEPSTAPTCDAKGYSRSETWYAVLDYGTNYCNRRNLIDGAGLTTDPKFTETTSDSVCTQYSSRNCEKY